MNCTLCAADASEHQTRYLRFPVQGTDGYLRFGPEDGLLCWACVNKFTRVVSAAMVEQHTRRSA